MSIWEHWPHMKGATDASGIRFPLMKSANPRILYAKMNDAGNLLAPMFMSTTNSAWYFSYINSAIARVGSDTSFTTGFFDSRVIMIGGSDSASSYYSGTRVRQVKTSSGSTYSLHCMLGETPVYNEGVSLSQRFTGLLIDMSETQREAYRWNSSLYLASSAYGSYVKGLTSSIAPNGAVFFNLALVGFPKSWGMNGISISTGKTIYRGSVFSMDVGVRIMSGDNTYRYGCIAPSAGLYDVSRKVWSTDTEDIFIVGCVSSTDSVHLASSRPTRMCGVGWLLPNNLQNEYTIHVYDAFQCVYKN